MKEGGWRPGGPRRGLRDGDGEGGRAFSPVGEGPGSSAEAGAGSSAWLATEEPGCVAGGVELGVLLLVLVLLLLLLLLPSSLAVANTKLGECTAAVVAVLELTSPPGLAAS